MEYALAQDDFVGISFWLATAIMLASTVFFLVERDRVAGKIAASDTNTKRCAGIVVPCAGRPVSYTHLTLPTSHLV